MPVAQNSRSSARQAILLALGALVGFGAVAFLVVNFGQLTNSQDIVNVDPEASEFGSLPAEEVAELITEQGPILLPDAASGDNDVYLQHLGDKDEDGWFAFAARSDDSQRQCTIEWQETKFVDPCDGSTFPADGAELQQYPIEVDDQGLLKIRLREQ